MVKHIVMFKFLESAQGRTKKENAQIAADMLINLQGKVPTLLSSEVKLNSVNADATNYDLILISDFNSWEDLQEYIVHPLHKAVGEFMKPVRESRSCVDYEYRYPLRNLRICPYRRGNGRPYLRCPFGRGRNGRFSFCQKRRL